MKIWQEGYQNMNLMMMIICHNYQIGNFFFGNPKLQLQIKLPKYTYLKITNDDTV